MACEQCQKLLDSLRALPEKQETLSIPQYMWGGLVRYLVHGLRPGDFLTAVLSNNLSEACAQADDTNRHHLFDYCFWLYNYAPADAWGNPDAVRYWLAKPRQYDPTCDLVL